MHTFFLGLLLAVKGMCSYKHKSMYAASFIRKTGTHTMIIQLSVTANRCQQKLSGPGAMADNHRVVGCTLEDRGLFCCLPYLCFLYFSNPQFPELQDAVMQIILGHWLQYSLAIAYCTGKHYKVDGTNEQCYNPLFYMRTLFYKRIFPYCSDV